jgi:hypothetical protein
MVRLNVDFIFQEVINQDPLDEFYAPLDKYKKFYPYKTESIRTVTELDKNFKVNFEINIFTMIKNYELSQIFLIVEDDVLRIFDDVLKPQNYIYLIDKKKREQSLSLLIKKIEIEKLKI